MKKCGISIVFKLSNVAPIYGGGGGLIRGEHCMPLPVFTYILLGLSKD